MTPLLKQRLEAKGFVLLQLGHGGWVHFFTKQPARTVADIKKVKMFAMGGRRSHGPAVEEQRLYSRWRSPPPTS